MRSINFLLTYLLRLQFLISVLIFAFCFSLFPDYCVSVIRYPCLFLLRLGGSNRFSGHFQQDCLGTFPEIFWRYLIICSLQCRKPVGHLCCKLYCFLFLEFLEIQRQNAVLSLSFSQSDFQSPRAIDDLCRSLLLDMCDSSSSRLASELRLMLGLGC